MTDWHQIWYKILIVPLNSIPIIKANNISIIINQIEFQNLINMENH